MAKNDNAHSMRLVGSLNKNVGNDIVNIGLHIFPKNVRPYATPCNEAQYCSRLTIGGNPPLAEQILRLFQ